MGYRDNSQTTEGNADRAKAQVEPLVCRPSQACVKLQVGKTKMAELIRTGAVESVLIGKTRLVTIRSIEALLYGKAA